MSDEKKDRIAGLLKEKRDFFQRRLEELGFKDEPKKEPTPTDPNPSLTKPTWFSEFEDKTNKRLDNQENFSKSITHDLEAMVGNGGILEKLTDAIGGKGKGTPAPPGGGAPPKDPPKKADKEEGGFLGWLFR